MSGSTFASLAPLDWSKLSATDHGRLYDHFFAKHKDGNGFTLQKEHRCKTCPAVGAELIDDVLIGGIPVIIKQDLKKGKTNLMSHIKAMHFEAAAEFLNAAQPTLVTH